MTTAAEPRHKDRIFSFPAALLLLTTSGCSKDAQQVSGLECGDGVCKEGEDGASCEEDCGACDESPTCPDGVCSGDETCSLCEEDCGACPEKRPNIVLIIADDVGYGDLSAYGHPYSRTPRLDKLADEGVEFRNFYVTGVTCSPSRTGFMTSRHPASYANYPADWGFQDRQTITNFLHNAGYATGPFGKWHIGNKDKAVDGVYNIDEVDVIGGDKDNPDGRDFPIFQAAMQFMENNHDRPFYMNVWGHATHYPVNPNESLSALFEDVTCRRADFGKYLNERFDSCEAIGGDIVKSMRNYLGDLYGLDSGVGLLLDKIDELGLRDNTIVVFTSDQGPAPITVDESTVGDIAEQNMLGYAGGLRGTKHTQYEGGVRVPFIVRWPKHLPVGRIDKASFFSGLDCLPTIASIVGVPIEESWYEGEDVSDIWMGDQCSRANPLFWRTSNPYAEISMLQGKWKLHVNGEAVELYALYKDKKEKDNVADQYPDIIKKLKNRVEEWRSGLPSEYSKDSESPKIDDPNTKPNIIKPANI